MLTFPDIAGLRPTPDRVRQTLFNWLGQDLHGLTCLDLFSGTGVMGFESLSRGASRAVLIEKSMPAYRALIENKTALRATNAEIHNMDAMDFLKNNTDLFNVIFVDPPYNQNWLPRILPLLQEHLHQDGYLYVEAEYALEDLKEWQITKRGKAGNVFYHLLKVY